MTDERSDLSMEELEALEVIELPERELMAVVVVAPTIVLGSSGAVQQIGAINFGGTGGGGGGGAGGSIIMGGGA